MPLFKKQSLPSVNLRTDIDNDEQMRAAAKARRMRLALLLGALLLVALVLVAFLVTWLWRILYVENKSLTLRHIDFRQTAHYSTATKHGFISIATILSEMGINLNQTNLLTIDLEQTKKIFQDKHPLLGDICISKILPDTLKIEANEHLPLALLAIQIGNSPVPQRFPIAPMRPSVTPPRTDYAPDPVIILPRTINLYNEKERASLPWSYALYPHSFQKSPINSIPSLFGFNITEPNIAPGSIIRNKQLNTALELIRLTSITSSNTFFSIDEITLVDQNILKLSITPTPSCRKLQPFCRIDLDIDNAGQHQVQKLLTFIKAVESEPGSKKVLYINATTKNLYASPTESP